MKIGLSGLNLQGSGGQDRYAKILYEGLVERDIDVEPVWREHPDLPLKATIHSLVSQPLEVIDKFEEYDIIHATHPGMAVAFPFIDGSETRKVVTWHDLIPLDSPESICGTYSLKNRLLNYYNRIIFRVWFEGARWSDWDIVVSSRTKMRLLLHKRSLQNITIIPEYPSDKFKPMDTLDTPLNIAGYFGPITHRKRVHKTLEVIKELGSDWQLWICGMPDREDYINYLKKRIKELEIENQVLFMGWIPESELLRTVNHFDVCLFPTSEEGFGLPIIELDACDVPVITLEDSKVPLEVKVLTHEAKDIKEMAELGRVSVEEGLQKKESPVSFEKEDVLDKTVGVYERVLEDSPPKSVRMRKHLFDKIKPW